jgi:hypothetical protein
VKQRWRKEIKAWADGAEIEVHRNGDWVLTPDPQWNDDCSVYRIQTSKALADLQAVVIERDIIVQAAQGKLQDAQAFRAEARREYEWALHESTKWTYHDRWTPHEGAQ